MNRGENTPLDKESQFYQLFTLLATSDVFQHSVFLLVCLKRPPCLPPRSDCLREATDESPKTVAIFMPCITVYSDDYWMPHSNRNLETTSPKVTHQMKPGGWQI